MAAGICWDSAQVIRCRTCHLVLSVGLALDTKALQLQQKML